MAAIINIDFSDFEDDMDALVALLTQTELWLRPVTVELSGEMSYRIHEQGLASDGSPIGSYSSEYLNRRIKEKLGGDTRVILVRTRKLSNSWGAFATAEGWAVGFVDEGDGSEADSLKKIQYNEKRFSKAIIELTEAENVMVNARLNEILTKLIEDDRS